MSDRRVDLPATRPQRETCWQPRRSRSRRGRAGRRAVLRLSGVSDEGAVLRAVRLRLQSADRLCRPAVVRPCAFFGWAAYRRRARRQKLGLAARARGSGRHARPPPRSAWSSARLAIRRQGIYFAMITLALAQMMYFFALQVPFTGGEDGIQGVPRGRLFGLVDLSQRDGDVLSSCCGDLPRRLPADLPHHPFAVRPSAEGDPRERAARDLAGLPDRPLQARGLRAVGGAGRARRRRPRRWCSSSPR